MKKIITFSTNLDLKKTAAILLSGILLFNWFGYRVVTAYLQDRANVSMVTALDQHDYNESELVSFKIPVNLPYYTNSPDFERVDGVILIDGIHYNFVKRRVFNDSLEYLCIANAEKMKISQAGDAFFKMVNDLEQPKNKKPGNNITAKSLLSDYCENISGWAFPAFVADKEKRPSSYTSSLLTPGLAPLGKPPEAC